MSIETFSARLKDLMQTENISCRALASRAGVQRKSLLNWLEARFYPRYDALINLADFFKVDCDYLLGLSEKSSIKNFNARISLAEIQKQFIIKLENFINEQNITKYRLALMLEMGQTTIKRWFTAGGMPETETLIKLSKLMNESVDYLLGRE